MRLKTALPYLLAVDPFRMKVSLPWEVSLQ